MQLLYACWVVAALTLPCANALAQQPDSAVATQAPVATMDELEQAVLRAQREASAETIALAEQLLERSSAQTPADQAQLAYFQGQVLELNGRAADAATHYQRSLELDPSGRRARHARNRLRQVSRVQLSDPQDAAIIMEFAELRAGWQTTGPEATIAQVTALLDRVHSPWLRADILIWLGMSWHHGLHDPEQAWQWYQQAAQVTPLTRQQANSALSGMVAVSAAAGRVFQTGQLVESWITAHPGVVPDLELTVIREEYQDQLGNRVATQFSRIVLPLFLLTFLATRSWRALRWQVVRQWKPWGQLAFIVWIFGGAAVIGATWAPANLTYMLACIPAVALIFVMTGAIARSIPRKRWLLACTSTLAALATLAALYTALSLVGGTALLGI
jgi:tetratricopeptide (TPR) repeat protein